MALDYDQRQEFPWPGVEEAAQRGHSPLFYRDLIGDPTGLSLPMFMEELFWGCAGIGLAIVMPALALSAIGQAASPEQTLEWAPECFGTPGDLKLAALAISEPEGGSDVPGIAYRSVAVRRGPGSGREFAWGTRKTWSQARQSPGGGGWWGTFRLDDVGHLRANPTHGRRPSDRDRTRGTGVCDGLCHRARSVRRTDHR